VNDNSSFLHQKNNLEAHGQRTKTSVTSIEIGKKMLVLFCT
jgi:hypothetical protein